MFAKFKAAIKTAKTSYELANLCNDKESGIDKAYLDGKITSDQYLDLMERFETAMEKLERAEGLYDEF